MDEIHALCLGSNWRAESREQIAKSMTSSFKEKYPNLGYIIDCVEFQNETPSSLVLHEIVSSHYKTKPILMLSLKKLKGVSLTPLRFLELELNPVFSEVFSTYFLKTLLRFLKSFRRYEDFFQFFWHFPVAKKLMTSAHNRWCQYFFFSFFFFFYF